jgi:hypothetical protein
VVARRFGRYRLAQLGGLVGVRYGARAPGVSKAEKRITKDKKAATLFSSIQEH